MRVRERLVVFVGYWCFISLKEEVLKVIEEPQSTLKEERTR